MLKFFTNFKFKEGEKEKIQDELSRIEKHFSKEAKLYLRIMFDEKKEIYTSSVTTNFAKKLLVGTGEGVTCVVATDEACDMLIRQIRKEKTKKFDKTGRTPLSELAAEQITSDEVSMDDFEKYGMSSDRITKVKNICVEPITVDEAIDEMEVLGRDFFVFNDLDGNVNVVYRRNKNKGFGLLKG